jgi:hypothetical protein
VATINNYNRRLRILTEQGSMNQSQFQETTVWVNNRAQPQVYQTKNAHAKDNRSLTPAPRPTITKSRSRSNLDTPYGNDNFELDDDRPARQMKRASIQTRRHFEDSDLEMDNAHVSRRKSLHVHQKKVEKNHGKDNLGSVWKEVL